ncbi:dihydropyrimidinase [Roseixanthobacter liquoris]|uniref:dihydropyrimidinase n=1 Tax=Roseixanthobacter liquoris TaxID=3119921 RepID=UPI00372B33AC
MAAAFDLVVRNGTVVTEAGLSRCDVGIANGIITALGLELGPGARELDATARLVLPGGIDAHCHIEQVSSYGLMGADDFFAASRAAAFGGTTTIVPFAAQHRGQRLPDVFADYHRRAREKSILDYSFHALISDPTEDLLNDHLPRLIAEGITSIKLFTAYDLIAVSDEQILDLLSVCREHGAMAMVHAENNGMIKWMAKKLIAGGFTAPKYHAMSHPRLAEVEAVRRCIALATLADAPLLIVHVSTVEALAAIRAARAEGRAIFGETCPQYLLLSAADLDLPGYEGAKFCFSPPPRGPVEQEALWAGLADGTLQIYSSDHAPYRMDETGKFARSATPTFKDIANGIPGIEVRLPLLFSEGVNGGRIDLPRFVALSATNAAKLYGLFPRKGTIAVGSDADLALWDPDRRVTLRAADLHDTVGYTPFEGREVTGWPTTIVRRGDVIVDDGVLNAAPGSGRFIARAASGRAAGTPPPVPETDTATNFGAALFAARAPAGRA